MHVKVIFVVMGYIEVKEVRFCEKKEYHHVYLMKAKKNSKSDRKKTCRTGFRGGVSRRLLREGWEDGKKREES